MDATERKMKRLVRRYNAMRALALLGWFLFVLMLAWHKFTWPRRQAVAIEVNGQPVVWLKDENAAQRARDELLNKGRRGLPGEAMLRPENITLAPDVLPEGQELASIQEAVTALEEAGVTVLVQGWAFKVGGKAVAVMDTEENAQGIKEGLKKRYAGEEDIVGEVEFDPPVTIAPTTTPPDKIETDIAGAVGKVTTAREGFITYTIKSGDTPDGIAREFGLSRSQLTEHNDWLKEKLAKGEYIFPGEKLRIPQETAGLTVIWKKQVTEQRKIPYKTIPLKRPDMPPGEKRILQSGQDGLKEVTAIQTWHNDQMVDEEIDESKTRIIRQPVTQKVVVHGTPSD